MVGGISAQRQDEKPPAPLAGEVPISEVCEKHQLIPTQFYQWQKTLFENGAAAIGGAFYYLCSILDGASRFIVHWEIRESMKEADSEMVLQKAREKYPPAKPRIISDNGRQFIARDFKEFIRLWQTSLVLTGPYYPQSNGKLERWHPTLKEQAIRPKTR